MATVFDDLVKADQNVRTRKFQSSRDDDEGS